jgi:predicted MFS family arabinose efflux permease
MRKILLMLSLIVAGEMVFGLVFAVPRFFRPTMLQVFGFSNTQLGDLFAIYGVTAMLSYFPGGVLADHFSPRSLIVTALFATAIGGLYMASIPSAENMRILYGYWGLSTIFLLWGALITATRDWGGEKTQGAAFGALEGGRGLVAAALATVSVGVLALHFPENVRLVSAAAREAGFRSVIYLYTLVTFLAGVLAWIAIPASSNQAGTGLSSWKGATIVLRRPIVWAQAGIIISAYCCYKGLDNYSLYAKEVLGKDQIEAARLASYGGWTRPVAAVIAGLVADRFVASRSIGVIFGVLMLSYICWAVTEPVAAGVSIIYLNFFVTYIAAFALRGVYFTLLEENRTPRLITGASVGIISFVGFTPDIFFAPIGGRILDANPGIVGFQNYFLFLAAIAAAGVLVTVWMIWMQGQGREKLWHDIAAKVK